MPGLGSTTGAAGEAVPGVCCSVDWVCLTAAVLLIRLASVALGYIAALQRCGTFPYFNTIYV